MYCAKCDKTIPDERIEEINAKLSEQFGNDSLSRGVCPVCGTRLMTLKRKVN